MINEKMHIGKVEGIPANIADKYKNICKVYEKVATHEKIAKWNEEHRR
jgi:hypothetical protein